MSFTRVRDHQVHYQLLGEGDPPVVFVHGMVMDNLASWYFTLATRVARSHRVLLYDMRGHGRSQRTKTGYTIPSLVADLDALLDDLGLDGPVVLIGNSFGALVALAYTMAHPDRVRGLAMVDGNMHDDQWNDEIAERFGDSSNDNEAARAEIRKYAYRYAGREIERKRNQLKDRAIRLVYGTSFTDDLSATPPFTPADLHAIRCPVLALYGEQSELAERARRMADQIPRCELVWFSDRTHLLLWEATAEVRERILDWLDRLD